MTRGPYRTKPIPGSFAELILRYRQSPRVLSWSPRTLEKNDRVLAQFLAANARFMVADVRRGDIIAMRDSMAVTPGAASNWLSTIRGLLAYAVDLEMIAHSPAENVGPLKPKHDDGIRTWREDEIAAFEAHWSRGSLPRMALTLALYTGAARGDLVQLGWFNTSGDRIRYRRAKTGATVDIPILPPLGDAISLVHADQTTFLETKDGTVRSPAGLAIDMIRWCEAAGLGGKDVNGHRLSLHGLRKALGRRLAQAGCSPHEIMAVLGQTEIASAQIYTKAYDRAEAAGSAMEKIEGNKAGGNVERLRRNISKNSRGGSAK
jgi:integrase